MNKLVLVLSTSFTVFGGVASAGDWTGAYAGVQAGFAKAEASGAVSGEGSEPFFGLHGGYDYDMGSFVWGGEVNLEFADIALDGGGGSVENMTDVKLRAGYDLGTSLVYATVGYASVDSSFGNDNGYLYGFGADVQMGPSWTLGGELLTHKFEDINASGVDLNTTILKIKSSFRF